MPLVSTFRITLLILPDHAASIAMTPLYHSARWGRLYTLSQEYLRTGKLNTYQSYSCLMKNGIRVVMTSFQMIPQEKTMRCGRFDPWRRAWRDDALKPSKVNNQRQGSTNLAKSNRNLTRYLLSLMPRCFATDLYLQFGLRQHTAPTLTSKRKNGAGSRGTQESYQMTDIQRWHQRSSHGSGTLG
jgi:hypothetical protein